LQCFLEWGITVDGCESCVECGAITYQCTPTFIYGTQPLKPSLPPVWPVLFVSHIFFFCFLFFVFFKSLCAIKIFVSRCRFYFNIKNLLRLFIAGQALCLWQCACPPLFIKALSILCRISRFSFFANCNVCFTCPLLLCKSAEA
jgi:hypothetical protein